MITFANKHRDVGHPYNSKSDIIKTNIPDNETFNKYNIVTQITPKTGLFVSPL